ncbi:TauD/TfdA family dioxygenase [Congregibacter variabilis]|uniref:TauD/TfdA family dioxygenase n=1 Tax=Congregibacter variabilis TaxID=3081200 RepID=A0ABZ0I4P0_9GAMM|nr:TauD/TfdA family dioxygenase [Congregibacter sp. IMCC43200]
MSIQVEASGQACGAKVLGLDLSQPLNPETVQAIRAAWLEHHVLAFPDQTLNDDDLERFTGYFGPFGDDPFIAPVPGRDHVIAVERRAQEQAPLFAEAWHSDWSFQATPPIGTCLHGITIPPTGGDTLFANQHKALDTLPPALRGRIEGLMAMHSAKVGYAPDGLYGAADAASDRSMDIRPSPEAQAVQSHPLIRRHSETGRASLYSCLGYIVGIEGMPDEEAVELLMELYGWQTREENVYTHQWEEGMLIMWDNRCLLHRATGGYDGHDRLLHRTTIGAGAL